MTNKQLEEKREARNHNGESERRAGNSKRAKLAKLKDEETKRSLPRVRSW